MFGKKEDESFGLSPPNSKNKKFVSISKNLAISKNLRKESSPLVSSSISPEMEARVKAASGHWRYSMDSKNSNEKINSLKNMSEFPILTKKRSEILE